ncbi:MAG TPA: 2-dehydropantoate 2-reductase N-terminal domain-containing protein, partial [Candidatus Limnocylindrales bacterium]|nr:2-dehydropantoate 2-reductase N-terminal domain-containing protein [Candidatus Limnocylindrales bacterium]
MKIWGSGSGREENERAAGAAGAPDRETLDALQREGIDLDPESSAHRHPHTQSEPGEPPVTGIVGAGAVGTALGAALHRAGWPIGAVASRDEANRERFRSFVPGARGFAEANALL